MLLLLLHWQLDQQQHWHLSPLYLLRLLLALPLLLLPLLLLLLLQGLQGLLC
jgi:hypothetical protein